MNQATMNPKIKMVMDWWPVLAAFGAVLSIVATVAMTLNSYWIDAKIRTAISNSPAQQVVALDTAVGLNSAAIVNLSTGQTRIEAAINAGFERQNDRYDQLVQIMLDDQ